MTEQRQCISENHRFLHVFLYSFMMKNRIDRLQIHTILRHCQTHFILMLIQMLQFPTAKYLEYIFVLRGSISDYGLYAYLNKRITILSKK